MKPTSRGQILPIVMITMLVLLLLIGGLIAWVQNNSKWGAKNTNTVTASNFAEAGIDRATWEVQSTTPTWAAAAAGTVITGYNFDTTYTDIPGGQYRIKLTSGPLTNEVTILSEGRVNSTMERRAISAVFQNQTIYSALMSAGYVSWAPGLGIFWGPIISQGNINLVSGIDAWYFPLKYSAQDVIGTVANPRDTTWPLPPNTDNVEWWANYPGVPSVPILDFATLRSSAAATGTLNIYGCKNSTYSGAACGVPDQGCTHTSAPWDLNANCNVGGGTSSAHNSHFGNSTNYIQTYLTPGQNYVWYWDNDVELTGQFNGSNQPYSPGRSTELMGTIVVRGNLTIDSPGDFIYTGHVPTNAWQQENKLTKTTYDTAASNEYPADTGLHQSAATFGFGYSYPKFCVPLSGSCNEYATVGMRGLVYVGGNLTILSYMDINGALWVNGNVTASGGSYSQFCSIFYDDTLTVPTLNVVLLRKSWQEVAPSTTAWP